MNELWPKVKLGEVLTEYDSSVPASELAEVNLAGVYSFARGLFTRGVMSPGKTSYKTYNRLESNDFVISTPKAWEGALALVTPEFNGWFLSPVFPTFRANRERLLPSFLDWYCKRKPVWNELQGKSRGIGARRETVHPDQFLSLEIPLPPLAEQRRIVSRIEELSAQILEASALRQQAAEEAERLMFLATAKMLNDEKWQKTELGNLLAENPRNGLSPQKEVESGGRVMLRINAVSSSTTRFVDMTAAKSVEVNDKIAAPFVIKNDDVFIVRYNGDINRVAKPAIFKGDNSINAVYPDKLIRLRPDVKKLLPDFLVFSLNSRNVRKQIEELGKTTAGNIGISGGNARGFVVPIPPLAEQRRIVAELDALQAQMDALKRLQAETAAELDALLPAILDRAFKGEL